MIIKVMQWRRIYLKIWCIPPQWRPSAQWSKTVGEQFNFPNLTTSTWPAPYSLKSSVEECSSSFDHQATPMVSPSPSSPWAILSTRASVNLLKLANLRHIFNIYKILLRHTLTTWSRCWTWRPRTRPSWTESWPRPFSPGLARPPLTSLLTATTVVWVFFYLFSSHSCCFVAVVFVVVDFFHLFIMFIEKLRDYFNFPNFS